ncbi:MAG: adenosylcobalamin-dependent ribonucleoside-diphosphate reductase [Alphaproteobacteria bacterium]|nr:adenosylcobalamin-dependent ribonucleoside-diphosphate reductase [Alphaproteobacteria bacterium]
MSEMSDISLQIWEMKYRYSDNESATVEKTVAETWSRVATALSAPEREPAYWRRRFLDALSEFRFLPAGRILAGAGTDRDVTLFNCFVMGAIADDMVGIFDNLKEAALTLQQGGGIGYDFSTLRPHGAPVRGVGSDASGPLSFMDVWDAMCRTIMSAGSRRGAMMGTLRCDHPDIEAFIDAKHDPIKLRMFNLSVLVTDDFMKAVRQDDPWDLRFDGKVHKTIRARGLWDRIMRSTYDTAEPGVIFIDRINAANNLYYCENIQATNPCGEQPLPPYGACLLGSVNLARLVSEPFTARAQLDTAALEALVPIAVRMLDNAIDVSRFPLEAQRVEALAKRRIGLGVTGLADAFAMCGVRYGSCASVDLTRDWLGRIRRSAYLASTELSAEKGAFPLFDRDAYLAGETIQKLEPDILDAIAAHGIRNALLTSIAPTGTISLFAENVSSGIEPIFAGEHQRSVLLPNGSTQTETVTDFAYGLFRSLTPETTPAGDAFVNLSALAPADHLAIQSAAQDFVDSSISKTVNLPEDISFDAFKDIYQRAYDLGCKGCTTFRPNEITGSVLSTDTEGSHDPVVYMTQPLERPETLEGRTYKITWPDSDHAIYITVNDIFQDGRRRPFEVFINSKNMEHYAWTVALTRMISAVFRRGGDVSFVVEELKAVFDPRGGHWMQGKYVPSLLAAIGEEIERHMIDIGFLTQKGGAHAQGGPTARGVRPRQCPKCSGADLRHQEGCDVCGSCGFSKCA